MELGAGIPESWLEVSTKAALPLSMPSLKVGQTLPISQGFIGGQEWGEDKTSQEWSAKSSCQLAKVLALVMVYLGSRAVVEVFIVLEPKSAY